MVKLQILTITVQMQYHPCGRRDVEIITLDIIHGVYYFDRAQKSPFLVPYQGTHLEVPNPTSL